MIDFPTPKQIADRHDLWAKKSLGQNFIFDLNLTRKIASAAGNLSGADVIEIGPGPGGLTQAILEKDINRLYAIEFDERAIAGLKELDSPKLEIINGDALKIDLRQVAPQGCIVIANLPYNIGTKLLMDWLEYASHFKSLTLMFQKEVAERIVASPAQSKDYGRVSVITQWLCEVDILFDVPPTAFVPAPKVTSSIVKVVPREKPLFPANKKKLEMVVKTAFSQRRKMLRASLKSLNVDFVALGIRPEARAEQLSIEDFCKITNSL
jgi:16S rRNA (adenine1518-N6/adenine1519-N6)-dimethyltransferase